MFFAVGTLTEHSILSNVTRWQASVQLNSSFSRMVLKKIPYFPLNASVCDEMLK